MDRTRQNLSVVIPAFNEEKAIGRVITELQAELGKFPLNYEIIVVNDGSTDDTGKILTRLPEIKAITHPENKGYGSSLKTGIKNSQYPIILFFDADGQHRPEYIQEFIKNIDDYDMVVGARQKGYRGPTMRMPGKKFLYFLANYLTGQKIPDLNSGFRLIKKRVMEKFLHLMPNSFSFSTTSTLVFIKENLNIKFIPVESSKRIGKSTVKVSDGLRMFMLILRTIILFSPLRIFLPTSLFLFIAAFVSGIYDVFIRPYPNITDATILFFISSILIFFFGLLADQISAIRREINN